MIKNINHSILLSMVIIIAVSCKKDTPPPPPPPPITEFKSTSHAVLFDLSKKDDPDDSGRQLYSARHILEVSGIPYSETSDINLAINASLILVSSPIDAGILTSEEISSLNNWINNGGVIIAPACEDINLQSLFGFSGVANYHNNRYMMSWVNEPLPELVYFDHENEKTISLGKENGNGVVKSYGYSVNSTGKALANFDTGEVAVIRNIKGKGRAYLFGLEWRDVIQRPQLNKDFEAQRAYSNGFEPSADIFPLFVRSVWNDIHPVSAWKYTIPDGYKTVLIPTHDVDATSGYDLMGHMSDYEKSLGLKSMYFMTTRYFGDDLVNIPYYTEASIKLIQDVVNSGHTIGSHSVGHFPDFSEDSLFPLGSASVTKEDYNPEHINEKTVNATTYGEIKVSKDLLEFDIGVKIRSFRPGHLLTNSFVTEGLDNLGYSFHSSFAAGDILTAYPFFERTGYSWKGELTSVMQIPVHISDSGITRENYTDKANVWLDVLNSLGNNYAPCVLLIHPTRKWKTDAQEIFIDKINRAECGLYNMEDYGDFWKNRSDFQFELDYQEENQQLVIKASKIDISKATTIGLMIENKVPIKNYRLIDNDFTEHPVSVKLFGDNKTLIIIQ